ncbi:aminotransferase class I/II-fold pyridoxal phosphate-dependent enzyme [Arachidicoccus sp.]|jgi:8-amino-7-oxononanoate synthase|uniref:aminotransferase class I/II-fold pyridoxal phosphate-dependent enzyme n=1 Tax=Arachidicoccus sp. TaxID=1872624 RepID=UPI003D1F09F6
MQTKTEKYIEQRLQQREIAGNKRHLQLRESGIDFFSNDYLGIARKNLAKAESANSSGSTGSRLLSGNSKKAIALEEYLADIHLTETALLFNSGYDANLGLLSSLGNRHTIYLYDELAHASIIDGIRLSFCKQSFRFKHNDYIDLKEKLQKFSTEGVQIIVVIESVYSMEGDIAPIEQIVQLCASFNVSLIVDEAHATGVFGEKGEGIVQQLNLHKKVFARVHTFGKAVGSHGAVVVGSNLLKAYLVNFARSFIYTTALPDQALQAIENNYIFIQNHPEEREKLHSLIQYFNQRKKNIGNYYWKQSASPIQSLILSNNDLVKIVSESCKMAGINVSAIKSPTVAKGEERIRICLHSFNTKEEINLLLKELAACLSK